MGGGSERNRVHSAEGRKKKRGVGAEEMKEKVFGNHWLADLCNSDFCRFFFFFYISPPFCTPAQIQSDGFIIINK